MNGFTDVTVGKNGIVDANGTNGPHNGEAINPNWGGNVITNYGTIQTRDSAVMWFENGDTGNPNKVYNYGTMRAGTNGTLQVVGNSGNSIVNFVNESGGTVRGDITLGGQADSVILRKDSSIDGDVGMGGGNDSVTIEAGAKFSGNVDGQGGTNTLTLSGDEGSDTLKTSVKNFSTLIKDGDSLWNVSNLNSINANSVTAQVKKGTLAVIGDNANFRGTMTVDTNGTLQIGDGNTAGNLSGNITDNGLVLFNRTDTGLVASNVISGSGGLEQAGSGMTTLTGASTYSGATTISNGTLQLGNGGTAGSIANTSAIHDNGTLITNRSDTLTLGQVIDGSGALTQNGSGIVVLQGDNAYKGETTINAGTLQVDGDQSLATGTTTVNDKATLAGSGVIGGNVVVAAGGTLDPGDAVREASAQSLSLRVSPFAGNDRAGTLTVNGDLILDDQSVQNWDLGDSNTEGGPNNDLIAVKGNLTLGGTLNVHAMENGADVSDGRLGEGVYRVYTYDGSLTRNNERLGSIDEGDDVHLSIQTSVRHQVNLIVTKGTLTYWDGANHADSNGQNSTAGDSTIEGGDGVWSAPGGNGDGAWTNSDGTSNGGWASDSYAVFEGQAGTVTVNGKDKDGQRRDVTVGGMQFANNDGGVYDIKGDPIYATNPVTNIRVGDGTREGSSITARIDSVIDDSKVDGGTRLQKTDTGTLILGGNNTYRGGTEVRSGTLVGSTSSFGEGDILNNSTLVLAQDNDSTLNNGLSGRGDFIKDGSNTLSIDRSNDDYTGRTIVRQGTLNVDGSMANSPVTVERGSTLSGSGVVGSTNVGDGATLSPAGDNNIGTMTVNGDLMMGKGSVLNSDGSSANGTSDLVKVMGEARLAGGTLNFFTNDGDAMKFGQTYTLLTAQNGVTGRFDSLMTNLRSPYLFLSPQLAYNPNDVSLSLQRNAIPFTSVAETRNQRATASALDSLSLNSRLMQAFLQLDAAQARRALDSLSGEVHASVRSAMVQDSFFTRDAVINRLLAADCDENFDNRSLKTAPLNKKLRKKRCYSDRAILWGEAFGSLGHNSSDGNAAMMSHSTAGFIEGVDVPVFDAWRVGGVVGYGRSMFDIGHGRGSSGHSDNITLGGYAGTHWDRINLRLGATYTWNMIRTRRMVAFPGYSDTLNSNYLGGTAQGFADLGYRIRMKHATVEPFADVAYVNVSTGSYNEKGGDAALSGRAMDTGVTFSTFGVRAAASVRFKKLILKPFTTLAYRHAFGLTVPTVRQRFAMGGNEFGVAGVPISTDAAVIGAGLNARLTDRLDVSLSYIGQYGNHSVDSGARGGLSLKF